MQRLGHTSSKGWLRNDLALTNRQRAILIRLIPILGQNKLVPWNGQECLEYALVCYSSGYNIPFNKSLSCLRKSIYFAHQDDITLGCLGE